MIGDFYRDREARQCWRWLGVVGLVWVVGCATGPQPGQQTGPIFYPPPPAPARLQFLASYSNERDLGAEVSKFAAFVTGEEPPQQPITKPYGVLLANNQLLVCDTGHRGVDLLDLVAKKMRVFAPTGMAGLHTPLNLAVDPDGTRYVADSGRKQVLIYGPDERLRATIGENEPMKPTGVAVTTNRIHVADLDGHCIRVYAKETRQLLFTIPRQPAANQPGRLFMPVNLAIDKHGNVYVSDLAACQVQVFDAEGKHLRTIGSRGDMPGQFARPKGIAVDRAERVYVVDAATQVCQVFDDIGRLLLYFGEPGGSPAPLNLPAGVAIDYDHVPLFQKYVAPGFVVENLVIITNQYGDRKVSVYGLGHKQ